MFAAAQSKIKCHFDYQGKVRGEAVAVRGSVINITILVSGLQADCPVILKTLSQ
jgi:hypothetical protein